MVQLFSYLYNSFAFNFIITRPLNNGLSTKLRQWGKCKLSQKKDASNNTPPQRPNNDGPAPSWLHTLTSNMATWYVADDTHRWYEEL